MTNEQVETKYTCLMLAGVVFGLSFVVTFFLKENIYPVYSGVVTITALFTIIFVWKSLPNECN